MSIAEFEPLLNHTARLDFNSFARGITRRGEAHAHLRPRKLTAVREDCTPMKNADLDLEARASAFWHDIKALALEREDGRERRYGGSFVRCFVF